MSDQPDVDLNEDWQQNLADFMEVMETQTTRNWHKGGRDAWLKTSIDQYLQEAQQNLAELRVALAYGNDVGEKAADVANDLFYIWDIWTNNPLGRTFTGE